MHIYNKVVLALGSNLGDKKAFLDQAVKALHQQVGFVKQASAVYETPAWGFDSFPFYNMCVLVHTHLNPTTLLQKLKDIEQKLGRTVKTTTEYAARTVDIDIIYFNDDVLTTDALTIPHPQMQHRKFVLVPLNDLNWELPHPILQKNTEELLAQCIDTSQIKKADHIALPKDAYVIPEMHFMVIEGNIGSGKTTLVQKIATDFNAKTVLERFADNPFLPKFYEDQARYAFPLEMSFLADRYLQLMEDLNQYDLFSDFIVADYYIYKSLIFSQVTLEKEEATLYRTLFDVMNKEIIKPNVYIYLHQTTSNLLQNIKKRGRSYEENMDPTYLDKISNGYSAFIKTLPQKNVLIIDVTNKDFVNNHSHYVEVLEQINEKIKHVTV